MQRKLCVLAVFVLLAAGWGMLAVFVATGGWDVAVLIGGWGQKSPLVGKWLAASKIPFDVLDADGTVIGKDEVSGIYVEFDADGAVVYGSEFPGGTYGVYKAVDGDQLELDFGHGKAKRRFSLNGNKLEIQVDARRFGQTTLLLQRVK
jgi:hypothetical protein